MTPNFDIPNMDITKKLYCFIEDYINQTGIPPSQREMSEGCYIATGTLLRHMDRLHAWGYIERVPGAMRGIKLAEIRPDWDCGGDKES